MLYAGTISIKVLSTFHYVMPEWGLHLTASSGSMLNRQSIFPAIISWHISHTQTSSEDKSNLHSKQLSLRDFKGRLMNAEKRQLKRCEHLAP
jgi:hypothetical protein